MDKFTLYVHPDDLFRVRMHRFWPQNIAGNAIEKVHYHKWHMSTVMLKGEYEENRFTVEETDAEAKRARLRLDSKDALVTGETNFLAARSPHQVHNASEDFPAITLFVRGPALQQNARISNEDGSYYDTYSPKPQQRHALSKLADLNSYFHPIPETPERGA